MDMIAGFVLGLAGSMHCAGMCGPLVAALPSPEHRSASFMAGRIAYNVGRVSTYAIMGVVVGLGGSVLSMAIHGMTISVVSGVLMIMLASAQLLLHRSIPMPAFVYRLLQPMRKHLAIRMQHNRIAALVGVGMLNGLLPCGMVTAALVGAAGAGSALNAAGFMTAFGMGTAPMMMALAVGLPMATGRWKNRFRTAAPIVALLLGVFITVRGMGLGIPMLSPASPQQHNPAPCCTGH
jgi:sulfite exporter TauE/SafE